MAIILGDTGRWVNGFLVYRKDQGDRDFTLLTSEPVVPVSDPYAARELIGADYRWLAGNIGTADPVLVWRRLRVDRSRAQAYCLLSHGLRMALGRTAVDTTVIPGNSYTYRIVFLDANMRERSRFERAVRAGEPPLPNPPAEIGAEAGDREVTVRWEYPAYAGGEDTVVGFNVYRFSGGRRERLTPAPLFRTDGALEYYDESVVNDASYRYAVTAVDIIGVESRAVESATVIPRDTSPPLVPTGITAVDTGEAVRVLWNVSPDLDVASYDVLRSTRSDEGY